MSVEACRASSLPSFAERIATADNKGVANLVRDSQSTGSCPECNRGMVTCLHNHFATAARTIDSWEHRCADCGYRRTQAFRTDDPEFDPTIDPTVCPFCGRNATVG